TMASVVHAIDHYTAVMLQERHCFLATVVEVDDLKVCDGGVVVGGAAPGLEDDTTVGRVELVPVDICLHKAARIQVGALIGVVEPCARHGEHGGDVLWVAGMEHVAQNGSA